MTEKKNSPALPSDAKAEWDARIGSIAQRFVYCSLAGAGCSCFFRGPVGRWASVAFGVGVGVGSAYKDFYGSLAKFANPKSADIPASPNGED